jgi:1,4-alpha-glucan branching enzyme
MATKNHINKNKNDSNKIEDSERQKFYLVDKDLTIKRSLDYYHDNKKKLNKKIVCVCNGKYTYKNKSIHIKTKIHQTYLKGLNDQKIRDDSDSDSDSDNNN